jgi:hypothetical protein
MMVAPMAMHGMAHPDRELATARAAAAAGIPMVRRPTTPPERARPEGSRSRLRWLGEQQQKAHAQQTQTPMCRVLGRRLALRGALMQVLAARPAQLCRALQTRAGASGPQVVSTMANCNIAEVAATGHPCLIFQLYVIK